MKPGHPVEPIELCPTCGEPTLPYLQDVVAAVSAGRVREFHRNCIPPRRLEDRRSVSARLGDIFDEGPDAA